VVRSSAGHYSGGLLDIVNGGSSGVYMEKLTEEQVTELVRKIRKGEGDDIELVQWISEISLATSNPEVIKTIMLGDGITVEEIVETLYIYKPIIL